MKHNYTSLLIFWLTALCYNRRYMELAWVRRLSWSFFFSSHAACFSFHPPFRTLLVETVAPDWLKVTKHSAFEVTVALLCCAFLKKLVIDTAAPVFYSYVNLSSTTSVSATNSAFSPVRRYHDPDLDPGSLLPSPRESKHDYLFNVACEEKKKAHSLLFTVVVWCLVEAVFWLILFNAWSDPEDTIHWRTSCRFKGLFFYAQRLVRVSDHFPGWSL